MARTASQERLPLTVIDDWRIDPRTREAGRRGLAEARAALAAAGRRAEEREAAHRRSEAA